MTDAEILRGALHQIAKSGKTQMPRADVAAMRQALGLHHESTLGGIALALAHKSSRSAIYYRGSDYGRKGEAEREPHFHFGTSKDSAVGNGQIRDTTEADE